MGSAEEPSNARTRYGRIAFACVALAWLVLDQLTKMAAEQGLVGSFELIPGFLGLSLVHNTGGAWGVLSGMPLFLAMVSIVVCILIVVYVLRFATGSPVIAYIGLALVFAGGLGNVIDRIFGGYVIDFISFRFIDFPVFNIADIGVTCGILLFVISLFLPSGCADGEA